MKKREKRRREVSHLEEGGSGRQWRGDESRQWCWLSSVAAVLSCSLNC